MRIARVAALGLVVAVAVAPAAGAQKVKGGGSEMYVGPWAGLNFASFSVTNLPGATFGSYTGFAIGGELQRTLSPNIFLRVGAFYSMRGSELTDQSGGGSVTIKLSYIEIPAVVGYSFAMQGSSVQPYVMAGGQFAFKASCSVEGGGVSVDCDTALGGSVSGTDLGLTFGAGVAFPAGSGRVMVDARYLIGLTNLVSAITTDQTIKNQGFTITAGYMIPVGR